MCLSKQVTGLTFLHGAWPSASSTALPGSEVRQNRAFTEVSQGSRGRDWAILSVRSGSHPIAQHR